MKIISKYKDYYDFVVGHDSDPRKVYIRKPESIDTGQAISYGNIADVYFLGEVWFCDKLYPYVQEIKTGTFWYDYYRVPDKVKEQIRSTKAHQYSCAYYHNRSVEGHFDIELDKRNKYQHRWYSTHFRKIKQRLNTRYEAPVLFSRYTIDCPYKFVLKNGLLKDVKFSQVMTPAEAYTELYNWIPYHEPKMPDDPTDMGRFENKGFSKKSSFRGK